MANLAVLLPSWSVTAAGITLPTSVAETSATDLLLTRVPDPAGALTLRLGQRCPEPVSVQRMTWSDTVWAATGLLPSGRLCLLMIAAPVAGMTDVLAAPVGTQGMAGSEPGDHATLLAAAIVERIIRGGLEVAVGDFAWLHPSLDPASVHYFRR